MRARIVHFHLWSIGLALITSILALSAAVAGPSLNEKAIAYLESLPPETRIYVWPTRLRTYEIVGDQSLPTAYEVLSAYNSEHPGLSLSGMTPLTPLISLYFYRGEAQDYLENFMNDSRLPNSYKSFLAGLRMNYEGCVFTSLLTRSTWAVGGAVFMDLSRIQAEADRRECIKSGLDYINGFPTSPHFDYRQFPPDDVRRVVMGALMKCSADGPVDSEEVTRDGLTPLPTLECVVAELDEQE